MTQKFLTSKWGHTLDDAEFTLMVEPMPGTQAIFEYLNDCPESPKEKLKVYPPNSTVIVHNLCENLSFTVLGEVAKLVVQKNLG